MSVNLGFCIISALLLLGFIAAGVVRFGFLRSYSAYAKKWKDTLPVRNINPWSLVTFVAAALLVPVILTLLPSVPLQYFAFSAPLYLVLLAFTPNWGTSRIQYLIRLIVGVLCFAGNFAWLTIMMHAYLFIVIVVTSVTAFAMLTGAMTKSFVLWLEVFMLLCTYLSLLFPII